MDVYEYNEKYDIITISREQSEYDYRINITPYIIFYVTNVNQVVKIEIKRAKDLLKLKPSELRNPIFEATITYNHNDLQLDIKVMTPNRVKKLLTLEREVASNIISTQFNYQTEYCNL